MNTYLKRYLYQNVLNLFEKDEVDATVGKDRAKKPVKAGYADTTGNGSRFYVSQKKVADVSVNPRLSSYISKAEAIHSPAEMNSFIASLKDEKLAPEEKHAIWNPITETAKLQGWQFVNGAYV
jgi:hypothetical protein